MHAVVHRLCSICHTIIPITVYFGGLRRVNYVWSPNMWPYTPLIIAWEHEYSIALDHLITELDFLTRSCILTQTTATYP